MEYSLVELDDLSGCKASIYSLYNKEEGATLFDKFLSENKTLHISEINNILNRLQVIGSKTGAREQFFKINEGNLGDGITALYDNPDKNLRLYCIRFGTSLIVLGGGGLKEKHMKSFQEDTKLTEENYLLRKIIKGIVEKMKNKELRIAQDDYGDYFEGDLNIEVEIN